MLLKVGQAVLWQFIRRMVDMPRNMEETRIKEIFCEFSKSDEC